MVKKENGDPLLILRLNDLTIITYDVISKNPDYRFKNELGKIEWLKTHQFKVVDSYNFNSIKEVIRYRDEVMLAIRTTLTEINEINVSLKQKLKIYLTLFLLFFFLN